MKRLIAALVGVIALVTGCDSPARQAEEALLDQQVRPAVLAVPGVTGGVFHTGRAGGLSLSFDCDLTGTGDREALLATLDQVARTIVEAMSSLDGAQVNCTLSNGDEKVTLYDLGVKNTSLFALRQHYQR